MEGAHKMHAAAQNGTENFVWPYVQPPVFESFWFENFNVAKCKEWMEDNWTISIYICVAYLLMIFGGRKYMENRRPFNLQIPLALWNLGFAVFSVMGLWRCTPELWYVLQGPDGFHRSVCVRDYHNQPAAFWAWAFTLSKVFELGDTAFVILRKKHLLFVHYYHHGVALMICWCFYSDYEPIFRYFGICNYFVHTILYGYLFLKAIGVTMPRVFTKCIISLELLQMVVGVLVNLYAIWVKVNGQQCDHRTEGIVYQMLLYLSFVVLFIYLFKSSSAHKKSSLNGSCTSNNNGFVAKKLS
ncbi:Elongation of very long chain fatty acids protein 6 [Orchesella cincta]|uniref:Elongation of very long chain fatty acids protein n=1 Tax=Orchesella cincta TaxID=48709 RepID=A0A1D2NK10_ORCCI|nr:Elongation of very long chain fatty acids protein 6 [Orchesella cincta]